MKFINTKMSLCTLAVAFMSASTFAVANEELKFDEAQLFFELNNTDGDLGIHAKIDGDEWKKLKIEDPNGRTMLKIRVKGRLKRQGLTEIFFESAEPTFDELDPDDFFTRFPAGEYEIEGVTLDGEEIESEVELSHVLPASPENIMISGEPAAADCDAILPSVSDPVTISWDEVIESHPTLGETGPMEIEYYEVVVENEEQELVMSTMLPDGVTELTIPAGFISLSDEFKFEILARSTNGNKTAVESCFEVD